MGSGKEITSNTARDYSYQTCLSVPTIHAILYHVKQLRVDFTSPPALRLCRSAFLLPGPAIPRQRDVRVSCKVYFVRVLRNHCFVLFNAAVDVFS
jgi:hypothetical protein